MAWDTEDEQFSQCSTDDYYGHFHSPKTLSIVTRQKCMYCLKKWYPYKQDMTV